MVLNGDLKLFYLALGLNIFYFIYFVHTSIYLHKHYTSNANIQKGDRVLGFFF